MIRPHKLPIPVAAAEAIAKKYGYDQVVILARKVDTEERGGGEHVTTAGVDKVHCGVAAQIGDYLKFQVMGWDRAGIEVSS